MDVLGPERTTVEVCPTCGLDVRDGRHATSSHQNDEPVEFAEHVRNLLSALPPESYVPSVSEAHRIAVAGLAATGGR